MHFTIRRRIFNLLLVCSGALSISTGCAGDIEIHSSYAPSEALSAVGKSYNWADLSQEQTESWARRQELRELVHIGVEEHFSAKGYTRQAGAAPDFLVRLHMTKETRTDSNVNPHGETYEKISLIMDVIKPSTGRTLWRGAAATRLDSSATPEQRRARIRKAAQMLVDRFTAGNK